MSTYLHIEIRCDDCEDSDWFSGKTSEAVRAHARARGWQTALRSVPPCTTYGSKTGDLCPHCAKKRATPPDTTKAADHD